MITKRRKKKLYYIRKTSSLFLPAKLCLAITITSDSNSLLILTLNNCNLLIIIIKNMLYKNF